MPKLTGLFHDYPQTERLSVPNIIARIKVKDNIHILENAIGNHLLYSQSLGTDQEGVEIDLAILKELLFQNPEIFYHSETQRLLIPEQFMLRFPSLSLLTGVYLEVHYISGVTPVLLKSKTQEAVVGTIIRPEIPEKEEIEAIVDNHSMKFKKGSITTLPLDLNRVSVKFVDSEEYLVSGGKLGVVLDLRQ